MGGKKRGQLEKMLTVLDGTNRENKGGRKGRKNNWRLRGMFPKLCSVTELESWSLGSVFGFPTCIFLVLQMSQEHTTTEIGALILNNLRLK